MSKLETLSYGLRLPLVVWFMIAFASNFIIAPNSLFAQLQTSVKFGNEVFAIEEGPCVVCLCLTNTSESAISFSGWTDEAFTAEPIGKNWLFRPTIGIDAPREGLLSYTLEPREIHRVIIYLHHSWDLSAKGGELQILAKFRTSEPSENDEIIRNPVVFDFSSKAVIKPISRSPDASQKFLSRLREFGEKLPFDQRMTFYRLCLLDTKMKELLPLALEVARESSSPDAFQVVRWMGTALSNDEFWCVFEKEVGAAGSTRSFAWIKAVGFEAKLFHVGDREIRIIRSSPNLLARLAAAYYLPGCFNDAEFKALLDEAANWKKPLTENQLKPDVQLLSSDSFRQRELAASRLRLHGERGVSVLTKLLGLATDDETRVRLNAVIESCKRTPISEDEDYLVSRLLVEDEKREIRVAILKALTKNDPAAHITKRAADGIKSMERREAYQKKSK